MDAFLAKYTDNPESFGAAELDVFLRGLEALSPEAASASVERFVQTTAAEAHGVAVDVWARWKEPDVPSPGAAPANFLAVYRELFPE